MFDRGIPARADQPDLFAAQRVAQAVGRGQRRGAGALGQRMRSLDHPDHRLADLVVADQHEVIQLLAQNRLGQGKRRARG